MGSVLGRYRVVRALGAGGMGAVYEGAHVESGKAVAIKVLASDLAPDKRSRTRFLREAEAASRIDHPNVVRVIDFGADDTAPFIVMQLLRGEDLGSRLRDVIGGLELTEAADILLAACAGVFAAHQAGIIHRDLKPANIFLALGPGDEVVPRILDFGISKLHDSLASGSLTDPGAILGTTPYLSPEQAVGAEVDARADQYALGVVLYESLTGHRPFDGDTRPVLLRRIAEGNFPRPSRLRPDLPADVEAAILRALARDRESRFPDVRALGAGLLPFASARARASWIDFYRTDVLHLPEQAGDGTEDRRRSWLKAVLLAAPAPMVPLQTSTHPAVAPEVCSPTLLHPLSGVSETRTGESAKVHGRRATPWLLVAGTTVALGVGGISLLFRSQLPTTPWTAAPARPSGGPSAQESAVALVASHLEVSPTGKGISRGTAEPERQPAADRQDVADRSIADHVILEIADAPPGLVVLLDDRQVHFPLRLERSDRSLDMTVAAPGFETKQISINATADQKLMLGMRPSGSVRKRPGTGRPAGGRQPARQPEKKSTYILKL